MVNSKTGAYWNFLFSKLPETTISMKPTNSDDRRKSSFFFKKKAKKKKQCRYNRIVLWYTLGDSNNKEDI